MNVRRPPDGSRETRKTTDLFKIELDVQSRRIDRNPVGDNLRQGPLDEHVVVDHHIVTKRRRIEDRETCRVFPYHAGAEGSALKGLECSFKVVVHESAAGIELRIGARGGRKTAYRAICDRGLDHVVGE